MALNLDGLTASVHRTEGLADSVITLVKGLRDQVAAIPVDSSAGAQAAINALTAELDAKADALAAAVGANIAPSDPGTPPAPPADPAPSTPPADPAPSDPTP